MEEDCLPLLWQWSEKIRAENGRGLFHSSQRKRGKKGGVGWVCLAPYSTILYLPSQHASSIVYSMHT